MSFDSAPLQAKGAARADEVARRVAEEARRRNYRPAPSLLWLRGALCQLFAWKIARFIPPTPQPKHIFQDAEKRLPLAVASLRSVGQA